MLYRLQFLYFFFLMTLLACVGETGKIYPADNTIVFPEFSITDATFPLKIENLDWEHLPKVVHVNDGIEAALKATIYDYYFVDCQGDSSETYFSLREVYLQTLRLQDSLHTIFLLLFKYPAGGKVSGKVLFYNKESKDFAGKAIDFNLHALYDLDRGKLKPTSLKQLFKLQEPEIERLDYDKDGINEFKFTRLYHNGTANALETAILKINNNQIDTLDFKQVWIGPGTDNPDGLPQ